MTRTTAQPSICHRARRPNGSGPLALENPILKHGSNNHRAISISQLEPNPTNCCRQSQRTPLVRNNSQPSPVGSVESTNNVGDIREFL